MRDLVGMQVAPLPLPGIGALQGAQCLIRVAQRLQQQLVAACGRSGAERRAGMFQRIQHGRSIRRAEAGGFRWAQSQRLVGIAEIATEPDFLQRGCGRRGADVAIPGMQQRERGAGVRVVRLQRLQQRDQALRGQRDLIVLQLFRILQPWLGQLRKHLDDARMACVVGPLETEFALRNRIVAGQIHFVGRGDKAGFGILRPRQCGADTETAERHDPAPHRLARTLPTGGPGLCGAADPAEPSGRAPH